MTRVKDVMTDRVISAQPEATIDEAISLLLDTTVNAGWLKRGHGSLRMGGQHSTSGSRSENSVEPTYN